MTGRWTEEQAGRYVEGRSASLVDEAVSRLLAGRSAILEVGCGPGMLQGLLPAAFIAETDSSRTMLQAARAVATGGSVFALADASCLPFGSGSFDAAAAMAVLHELDPPDQRAALTELRRVTRAGGILVIVEDWAFPDPDREEALAISLRFPTEADREHHRSAEGWSAMAGEAGYRVTRIDWVRRPFDPCSTGARTEGRASSRPRPGLDGRCRISVRMLVLEGVAV